MRLNRLTALTVLGVCVCWFACSRPLWAQDAIADLSQVQEESSAESNILDDTMDFDSPPELPDVDAPAAEQIQDAIDRGVAFLIADQNPNGSWGSPRRTIGLNIYAPVPGAHHAFRAATTSLCISALIETASGQEEAERAIERGEAWRLTHLSDLRRATGDALYNIWGHAYSVQALVRLHQRHAADAEKQQQFREPIEQQFEKLTRYESVDGGWGYYDFRYQAQQPTSDSISFVNGTVLIALAEARSIGLSPPERIVQRAVAATQRQQKPDFSYLYGEYLKMRPMRGINRPGGSLGRSQCCNCALRAWGDTAVTDNVVKNWLYRLYARGGWLDIGRKRPIPHEAWFQVAGYFYYYAALCIEQLSADDRAPYRKMLSKPIVERQESDGSWWDYPLYDYHQPYGTAFALMTLQRCLPTPAREGTSSESGELIGPEVQAANVG